VLKPLLGQELTDSAPGISCQVPVDCSFCLLASNLASQVNSGVEHTMA